MTKILVINPGSTSTKVAVYEDLSPVFETTLRHSSEELKCWGGVPEQREPRKDKNDKFLYYK